MKTWAGESGGAGCCEAATPPDRLVRVTARPRWVPSGQHRDGDGSTLAGRTPTCTELPERAPHECEWKRGVPVAPSLRRGRDVRLSRPSIVLDLAVPRRRRRHTPRPRAPPGDARELTPGAPLTSTGLLMEARPSILVARANRWRATLHRRRRAVAGTSHGHSRRASGKMSRLLASRHSVRE